MSFVLYTLAALCMLVGLAGMLLGARLRAPGRGAKAPQDQDQSAEKRSPEFFSTAHSGPSAHAFRLLQADSAEPHCTLGFITW